MRDSDWSALGLGGDPVPGEPWVVSYDGERYTDIADAIQTAGRRLRSIDLGAYVSLAIDELRSTSGKVADDIERAERRYREAGGALLDYAPVLESAQSLSTRALVMARGAVTERESAESQERYYLRMIQQETDPVELERWQRLAREADGNVGNAAAVLSAAQQMLNQAITDRDRGATHATDRIVDVVAADGLSDSWFDDWGADVLAVITDVAGVVSTVAGILALLVCWIPVVGQVLAAALLVISAVAAIVNAVGNIVLAATGNRSWTDAVVSIIGAVLSCVGLGGAARVAGAALTASRITAKAATQEGFDAGLNTFTTLQALRINPTDLAQSEALWRAPIDEVVDGSNVFRLWGDDGVQAGSDATGASWTTVMPDSLSNPRVQLGLPSGGPSGALNTADNMSFAQVTDPSVMPVDPRHAFPLDGNPGGASEFIFPGGVNSPGLSFIESTPFVVR